MGEAFLHGNGGFNVINFKVVGGTTVPTHHTENTIWVNTDQKITEWVFAFEQPAGQEGLVWLHISESSSVRFNALKKNGLSICLINAYQYIDGVWTNMKTRIYQNNNWNDAVVPLIIVPNASTYPASVWTKVGSAGISVSDTKIHASYSSWDNQGANMQYIDIDVTKYTIMELVGTAKGGASNTGTTSINLQTGLFSGTGLVVGYATSLRGGNVVTIDNTYDITNLTGVYRFGFYFQVSSTSSYYGDFDMTSVVFK